VDQAVDQASSVDAEQEYPSHSTHEPSDMVVADVQYSGIAKLPQGLGASVMVAGPEIVETPGVTVVVEVAVMISTEVFVGSTYWIARRTLVCRM